MGITPEINFIELNCDSKRLNILLVALQLANLGQTQQGVETAQENHVKISFVVEVMVGLTNISPIPRRV